MSDFCAVKKRDKDSVIVWCAHCSTEMHFKTYVKLVAGQSLLGIPFEEWQTLHIVTADDDGVITSKEPYVERERVIDPNIELPAWVIRR